MLLGQGGHGKLEVARHHLADAVVVVTDQLAKEWDWQQRRATGPALLLNNDLCQNRMRQIITRLGIANDEVAVRSHHLGQIFQRNVSAGFCIIEAAVRVFLDYDQDLSIRPPCR